MTAVAGVGWLTDFFRMSGAKIEQVFQSLAAQMRLVAQHNRPVGQPVAPAVPLRSALNRTEHAACRRGIRNPIFQREPEPSQFGLNGLIARRTDDADLPRP